MLGDNFGREFNCWEITHVKNSAKHLPHTVWSLGARFSPYVISEELVFLVKKQTGKKITIIFSLLCFFKFYYFFFLFFLKPCLFLKLLSQLSQTRFGVPAVCCSLRSWQTLTRPPGPLTGTSSPILGTPAVQQSQPDTQHPSPLLPAHQQQSETLLPMDMECSPSQASPAKQDLERAPSPPAQRQALPPDCPLFGSGPLFFLI